MPQDQNKPDISVSVLLGRAFEQAYSQQQAAAQNNQTQKAPQPAPAPRQG